MHSLFRIFFFLVCSFSVLQSPVFSLSKEDLEVSLENELEKLQFEKEFRVILEGIIPKELDGSLSVGNWKHLPSRVYSGRRIFRYFQNGKVYLLPFRIEVANHLPILKHDVSKNSSVGLEDLQIQKEFSLTERRDLPKLEDLQGIAVRNLEAGEILTTKLLLPVTTIEKGKLVDYVIVTDSFSLDTKVKTLEEGNLGEVIKVQNLTNGKVLEGKVVHSKLVMGNAYEQK